jgi:type I restriction-modification system DNA methylase subunit
MSAPAIIQELVTRFEQNRRTYTNPHYNEATLRHEFLDPFFEVLGWDIRNAQGYADAYKDVVIETSQEVEGSARKPDYVFRAGGIQKFFVEAKKPSVNIETDPSPAFQVRRYAWSAKLPLSILTDFEEFAVYECRNKPSEKDPSGTGRIELLHYKDYRTRWDWIAETFSHEAVYKGSFDRYTGGIKGKRGTMEVDDAFLQEIEDWRDKLARNLALRNSSLTTSELNYTVQMTIDRIIFLRICEDRQIEPEDRLKNICSGEGIYPELVNLFRQADARYNSGLFHFNTEKGQSSSPDDLTPTLAIDDKVLKEIVNSLYYPSPYVFRVLPADILGQVYERFLGKVIRLTAGHQAKVEEKPEVRKAGGVYYTPTYIVEYIVKNTVGKLLENKTPAQVAGIKIVDPACGSGSFLLGAYQYLLNWHIKWYSDNQPEKWARGKSPAIYQAQGGWRLTTAEKKKILLNNIHGVDIDPQAVEVTKLSLSLKVLEGESQETINSQLSLFKERALPDLAKNIQCGNSLIGSDYNEGKLFTDEEERLRVNPFDWQVAFPQIFAQGGFDAVIGNPPYGASFSKREEEYFKKSFQTFKGVKDVYTCFIEKGIGILKLNGRISFIVPSGWLGGPQYIYLRKFVLAHKINALVLLPFDIFADAYIDTLIFVFSNGEYDPNHLSDTFTYPKKERLSKIEINEYEKVKEASWNLSSDKKIILNSKSNILIQILKKRFPSTFKDFVQMKRGVLFDKALLSNKKIDSSYYQYFEGNLYRYEIQESLDHWVEFGNQMKERPKEFYWFEGERILLRRLVNRQQRLMSSITDKTYITNKNIYSIKSKGISLYSILAIVNSKLISYLYLMQVTQAQKDDFPQVTINDILSLPIPDLEKLKKAKSELDFHVHKILEIKQKSSRTPQEKEALQREIAATDKQIDNLVYQLYGLTADEIKIVEGT